MVSRCWSLTDRTAARTWPDHSPDGARWSFTDPLSPSKPLIELNAAHRRAIDAAGGKDSANWGFANRFGGGAFVSTGGTTIATPVSPRTPRISSWRRIGHHSA